MARSKRSERSLDIHIPAIGPPPYPWDYTAREFLELQDATRDLIEGAAIGDGTRSAVYMKATVVDVVRDKEGNRTLRIGGPAESVFLLRLAFLLATAAGSRVVRCPECRRVFMRVRRQIYCTAKCTDRATWRNYPEAKKRALRKKQYEKGGWRLGARSGGSASRKTRRRHAKKKA